MERFCKKHRVVGDIAFTGGNPFLYPGFFELYREAARRGFGVEIPGNPVKPEQLEALCRIRPPRSYHVSLEGRRAHNDSIRGAGNYGRVMDFLAALKSMGIESGVMPTLTEDNLREVLPLARQLEGRTGGFSLSRLSKMGEGAALAEAGPRRFGAFLKRYIAYAEKSGVASCKDNLINLALEEAGKDLHDGCTGFGCGAAFNCVALLPDGEVHACRKFPSAMGNLWDRTLEECYYSGAGAAYRRGMLACDGCPIRRVRGGCMAAAPRPNGVPEAAGPFCWRLWPRTQSC